jgi:hypothetical protein
VEEFGMMEVGRMKDNRHKHMAKMRFITRISLIAWSPNRHIVT